MNVSRLPSLHSISTTTPTPMPSWKQRLATSYVPRCQWQGTRWIFLLIWCAFQTANFTTVLLICNGDSAFFVLFLFFLLFFALEAKQNVKWVTSLFSCNDFYKLLVCCVLFLRWFDLVGDEHTCRLSPFALSGVSNASFLLLITKH